MGLYFKFTVINEIKTKERPRARVVNGKFAQIYTPKTTASYENLIKTIYQNSGGNYFGNIPLSVEIKAFFAPSKEQQKYIIYGLKCINHKDLDNIAKTILDALNGIAYKDDKQVCDLSVSKHFSLTGQDYIEVSIQGLECGSLEKAKEEMHYYKLLDKKNELEKKIKLNSNEKKRLEEIKKELEKFLDLPF